MRLAALYIQAIAAGDDEAALKLLAGADSVELCWIAACLGAELRASISRELGEDHELLARAFHGAVTRAQGMAAVYSAELVLRDADMGGHES
ncbi:hypothetical protein EFL95_09055 [Nocardioides marmorisolisilvae]|uniref:Uncharacterized protein n=2 Tax=Nocardioides marmorisolisilvae TaxID=1542737 RepID=A0A3N0DU57_9ACTN|nr:hypothetical protein EFL95_09055 [Nocardioides marmorisolisilvae]